MLAFFEGNAKAMLVNQTTEEVIEREQNALIRVASHTLLQPMSEMSVLVLNSGSCLMIIEGHPNVTKKHFAVKASVVMDVTPGRPFYILFYHLSGRRSGIHIPKPMLVAVGSKHSLCIVLMAGDEDISTS